MTSYFALHRVCATCFSKTISIDEDFGEEEVNETSQELNRVTCCLLEIGAEC